jgi:hypothetical protein
MRICGSTANQPPWRDIDHGCAAALYRSFQRFSPCIGNLQGMAVREFGLICGDFSVGVANQFLLPKSEELYIVRSVLPARDPDDVAGRFLFRVYHDGHLICNAKVEVTWGAHQSQAEPFLAIKVDDDASALGEKLGKLGGKQVELRFTRIV